MLSPEEITAKNIEKANAIFEKFQAPSNNLEKSVDTPAKETGKVFTTSDITKFKEDLFKGIDEGTISEDDLAKAQDDLLDLKRETRTIEGKETVVFIKG